MNLLLWMAMLVLVTASTQHVHKPARILAVVPMPWKSHHFVFQTIIKALAARGHQIDYLTPFPIENAPPNIRHLMIKDTFAETIGSVELEDMDLFWSPQEHLMWRSMNVKYLEEVYRNEPAIRTLLSSNEQYAIVMSECNINQEITAVWAHRFNATPVSVLAVPDMFFANEMTGLPGNPSYMLDSTSHLSDRMDFFGEALEFGSVRRFFASSLLQAEGVPKGGGRRFAIPRMGDQAIGFQVGLRSGSGAGQLARVCWQRLPQIPSCQGDRG
uniref:Ecdysteroid UDP-glucosyltransferase n=1 Tax=Lygus hesperus TaxID=30085 RepID=A0A0A9ZHH5_LYGHE